MKQDFIVPYKIGEKVKVYLSEKPGVSLFTTGVIKELGDKPRISYKDLSTQKLSSFNRFVKESEVIMPKAFKNHSS